MNERCFFLTGEYYFPRKLSFPTKKKCFILTIDRCRALVIGGGTGGCTMASKLSAKLGKDECIVLEPSDVRVQLHILML